MSTYFKEAVEERSRQRACPSRRSFPNRAGCFAPVSMKTAGTPNGHMAPFQKIQRLSAAAPNLPAFRPDQLYEHALADWLFREPLSAAANPHELLHVLAPDGNHHPAAVRKLLLQ